MSIILTKRNHPLRVYVNTGSNEFSLRVIYGEKKYTDHPVNVPDGPYFRTADFNFNGAKRALLKRNGRAEESYLSKYKFHVTPNMYFNNVYALRITGQHLEFLDKDLGIIQKDNWK